VAAQRARAGRGETMRLIESGQLDAAEAKPSVPPPRVGAGVSSASAAAAAADETMGDADETGDRPDASDEIEAPSGSRPPPADAETSKRLATIQAAEKRSRDKIAAEKRELETRVKAIETEWLPRVKKAEDFEALQARAAKARSNPALLVDVFRALGFSDDHLEPVAQALYTFSKAGQADPARAKQAERMLREREQVDEVSATQRRLDELEAKITKRDQQSEFQRLQTGFLDLAVEAISDAAPIATAAVAAIEKARATGTPDGKAKAKTLATKLRGKLWEITEQLTAELEGDMPEFSDVIARYEEIRAAELEELGVPLPATNDPKKNNQAADKKNSAKTLSADLSTPRVPRPTTSGREHRKDTLRMLESGKFE
jgi:hypothetical protein